MWNFQTLWGTICDRSSYLVRLAKKKIMQGEAPFGTPSREKIHLMQKDAERLSLAHCSPEDYMKLIKASELLYEQVKSFDTLSKDEPILEIGCNVGRNLNFLYQQGFHNLYGIEINESAISAMKKYYPDMASDSTILEGPVEERIKEIKDKEMTLTFTMAVLETIHPSSNFIFSEISRITSKFLIVIEIENSYYMGMFPRDYGTIFTLLGFNMLKKELVTLDPLSEPTPRHTLRIFSKDIL